jgi:hypothetical protein
MPALYTAKVCRRKAEAAERKANGCWDPEARWHFEEIARLWREMADQTERLEEGTAGLLIEIFEAPKWLN